KSAGVFRWSAEALCRPTRSTTRRQRTCASAVTPVRPRVACVLRVCVHSSGGEENRTMFDPVDTKTSFPKLEFEVLAFWQSHDVQKQSCEKPAPLGPYIFYEGPPTANGKPGLHHVSARSFKDLFPRYKTMRGHRVDRRGGWDTHGLPVEVEIEKE